MASYLAVHHELKCSAQVLGQQRAFHVAAQDVLETQTDKQTDLHRSHSFNHGGISPFFHPNSTLLWDERMAISIICFLVMFYFLFIFFISVIVHYPHLHPLIRGRVTGAAAQAGGPRLPFPEPH